MKAIITVGLGFGDEGKGATVDYLTRAFDAKVVVRYSGGAQAGHNVVLPDGRRHTFSQFGAGTLAGASTYVAARVIICPVAMVPEADHLRSIGIDDPWSRLTVHPECLVSTGYHILMNRLRESARRDQRHGSCGLGIGETRNYWLRYGSDAVFAKDLIDPPALLAKLMLLRDRFLIEMQDLTRLDPDWSAMMHDLVPRAESDLLSRSSEHLQLASGMPEAETVIFEGAQGVLLDEWKGFHPYTTWSTVTPLHALEMLAEFGDLPTTILGITRAYATRHGAGPFPTECPRMSAEMTDAGNPRNDWQESIRFGPLDLVLTEYAARIARVDGIFVNALDQLPQSPRLARGYIGLDRIDEPHRLREQERLTDLLSSAVPRETETTEQGIIDSLDAIAPVVGISHGETHLNRERTQQWQAEEMTSAAPTERAIMSAAER